MRTYYWVWRCLPNETIDPFVEYYNKFGTSPVFIKIGEAVDIPLPEDIIILEEKPKDSREIWIRHENN